MVEEITMDVFMEWRDQPILNDEDEWDGLYKTYGEMWIAEGLYISVSEVDRYYRGLSRV